MKNNTSGPREEEEGWRSPGVGRGGGVVTVKTYQDRYVLSFIR